ncbi:hypothetical protein DTO164E3_7998 [Paecilomyces variotii]|nr:hypothetical protein DTO032I3_8088 [Paecilomyces variotii]KAJ9193174.1 hypothetical protein DTO164E3_7998 [Paecilomyces variotii]KAJ9274925.1 hypothetical protein DTO021D3_8193 [Paecilomyces variotii]KAJ9339407.1 hypothetical protein DTO027B6_8061 [Paecilomyces variotii]KAJ9348834.1 hypothetical protein DTO027B9_7977 [Paecilomyces variotii]
MSPDSPLSAGCHTFTNPGNGLTLEYLIHGDNDATKPLLVVQCPGWGPGSRYLQVCLAPLEEHFMLLFPHPRGTGGSTAPPDETQMGTMTHMSEDLEVLRIHLGLDYFPALLGHSNGGSIVLGYAEKYPSRVKKLILISHRLVGFREHSLLLQCKDDERYKDAFEWYASHSVKTDEDFLQLSRHVPPLYFVDPERHLPQFETIFVDQIQSSYCYRAQRASDMKQENPPLMIARLGDVKAKTLIIFGRQDLICELGNAYRTKEGISDAKLIIYDNCGHIPMLEKTEETLHDIVVFLSS